MKYLQPDLALFQLGQHSVICTSPMSASASTTANYDIDNDYDELI